MQNFIDEGMMAIDNQPRKTRRQRSGGGNLANPGPRKTTLKFWLVISVLAVLIAGLWSQSVRMFSEQPAEIKPAAVSGQAVQATVRASSFTASTGMLTVRVKFNATTDLLDNRGLLNEAIDVRVVDDEGVHLVQFEAGDPLSAEEISLQMDGDVNNYPYDTYQGSFSLLAETVSSTGELTPLTLAIGAEHAETGWFTKYEINREASDEAKITVVSMNREPFQIGFALILGALMLLLTLMAVFVGVLVITNRRESDPGVVGWLVGIVFALPFVRLIMPGDPPLGCLLDVEMFSWSMLLSVIAATLAMIAWVRQSAAKAKAL
jgi:hypothetical protein